MYYVNQYSDTCPVTPTAADRLRTARPENRRFGRRTTGGTACTQQKAEGTAAPSASYCILYLRPHSVPVVVAAAVRSRALGVALRLLGQMIGLLLRTLSRVLRVALRLFGRVLRLAGQLRRLTLFARDLLLRLAAQARLELLLMAQLLLGGVLLVPLLMRSRVLGMPLEQLCLMLGAALAAFGALALDTRVQLRAAGLDARSARGMVCAEVVVEVVAPLAHVLDELGIILLNAVDEAVALGLEVSEHIVLGVAEQRGQLVRVALQV